MPPGEEVQLKKFGLLSFTQLPQHFRDSTVMSEPVFSTLCARNLLLAQFQEDVVGGDEPTKRGKPPLGIISAETHRQILSWLDTGAATKLELLYRASYDGWEGEDFHLRCDNNGPTVTVIRCTDGYLFGGFTSTAWASSDTYVACADAFIFLLYRPGSVGPVKLAVNAELAHCAMNNHSYSGPEIEDIEVRHAQGRSEIICFELPPGHAPVDKERFFTGAENYRAPEVEVFRVAQ